jgi:RNA-directed DNA polymerase
MSTQTSGVQEWCDIPWPKVERNVHSLQRRIYRASQQGDRQRVHRLQRLLLSSWSAKCLAVRRVTQDNQGKKTPGVDGIASLEPEERLALVCQLDLDTKPKPIRRVWIAKPGTDEQRPLGIPTLFDRARQALVKLALEPEWEAQFEPHSYGFRPGRSCQDAIGALYQAIRTRPKYVLDADIAKCFERINHRALLDKLNTFARLRRLIKGWLKAGVLDGDKLFPTEEGTPQGGVLSPLLANVALHGLETVVQTDFPKRKESDGQSVRWTPLVVRYADDLVVCHPDRTVIEQCQTRIQQWLQTMGLELKPSKTRIGHTLEKIDGQAGFDFLGVTFRQYPAGKYRSDKDTHGRPLGFITRCHPSPEKVIRHRRRLKEIVHQQRGAAQETLLRRLNPILRGWCNYYRTISSARTFNKLDHQLHQLLWRWACRRHRNKGKNWIKSKYWRRVENRCKFACPKGPALFCHNETNYVRYVLVKGDKSPYDGDWLYWASRLGRYPGQRVWLATLLKRQEGKCARCGLYFTSESLWEAHHRDGNRTHQVFGNLELLHRHCHDEKHRQQQIERQGSVRDQDCLVEELCERESLTHSSEGQHAG